MTGCSLFPLVPTSRQIGAECSQQIENKRFRWPRLVAGTAVARAGAPGAARSKPADLAWQDSTASGQRRFLEWIAISLPGAGLLSRLPFNDAIKLAALVGTGRMTWPEINAALDAMIKLASADAPDEQEKITRAGEEEIWARYHARCDELFAGDAEHPDPGAWSREQLWRRERDLDRLRSARDRELAALRRRSASSAIRLASAHASAPRTQLTPFESSALYKLNAAGFVASDGMLKAITDRAAESTAV